MTDQLLHFLTVAALKVNPLDVLAAFAVATLLFAAMRPTRPTRTNAPMR